MNYNYQGRHPPAHLAAMVARQNMTHWNNQSQHNGSHAGSFFGSTWLADSGCNAHLTADLSNMSVSSDFIGDDQVFIGSGQSLPISHTGLGFLHTFFSSSFTLHNLLRVPHTATNLLSVHQLCVDNNCTITFDSHKFSV